MNILQNIFLSNLSNYINRINRTTYMYIADKQSITLTMCISNEVWININVSQNCKLNQAFYLHLLFRGHCKLNKYFKLSFLI